MHNFYASTQKISNLQTLKSTHVCHTGGPNKRECVILTFVLSMLLLCNLSTAWYSYRERERERERARERDKLRDISKE